MAPSYASHLFLIQISNPVRKLHKYLKEVQMPENSGPVSAVFNIGM